MHREMIQVEHLMKRYGSSLAVNDVSFTVAEGEVLGLLGPNGAGKTTTIEILEGMRTPSGGSVRVLGRDPSRGGRRLRSQVGIVLQSAGIDPALTVAEVVGLYASFYRRRRRPQDVIAEVNLEAVSGSRIAQLSGGQRRRVDLALALVGTPAVLFLDEPTTGLDPAARHRTWRVIERLRDQGVAILLTSHYLEEVQRLADRVIVLSRGRIVGEGPPGTLRGKDPALATISFRLPPSVALPTGPWESQITAPGAIALTTSEPVESLRILTTWAVAHDTDLPDLELRRPSLEEEYLELTSEP